MRSEETLPDAWIDPEPEIRRSSASPDGIASFIVPEPGMRTPDRDGPEIWMRRGCDNEIDSFVEIVRRPSWTAVATFGSASDGPVIEMVVFGETENVALAGAVSSTTENGWRSRCSVLMGPRAGLELDAATTFPSMTTTFEFPLPVLVCWITSPLLVTTTLVAAPACPERHSATQAGKKKRAKGVFMVFKQPFDGPWASIRVLDARGFTF